MVEIRDEVAFLDYLKEDVLTAVEDLAEVVYVDAGDNIEKRVEEYFQNNYKGTALFLGIYEGSLGNVPHNCRYGFSGQLTVLKKHNDTVKGELIQIRKSTRQILLQVIAKIQDDEETAKVDNFAFRWEIGFYDKTKFNPVSSVGASKAYGYSVDFDLMVGVDEVMYPG